MNILELTQELFKQVISNNLGIYNIVINNEFKASYKDFNGGYIVSTYKHIKLDIKGISEFKILSALAAQSSIRTSGEVIGLWIDNGYLYIDISENFENLEHALKVAKDNNQLAIFDLNNNEEIRL